MYEYTSVSATNGAALSHQLNRFFSEGWEPYGEVIRVKEGANGQEEVVQYLRRPKN